jgi:hypothetical protein
MRAIKCVARDKMYAVEIVVKKARILEVVAN